VIPLATTIPALASLAVVAALCSALVVYERAPRRASTSAR
jgi:hypothetical protein